MRIATTTTPDEVKTKAPTALQATKHVAKVLTIIVLLIATAIVVLVAS